MYNVNVILTVYHKIELVEKIQAPVTWMRVAIKVVNYPSFFHSFTEQPEPSLKYIVQRLRKKAIKLSIREVISCSTQL